ncbi:MAG TPA: SDR family oxidoreductase [Pseudolabrys sp.]|nr:SDR family oxidoreductase [Pseudolabrys sp.]
MARLKDKVAIITGGAGGIGSATGKLFAAEGAKVVLADIDQATLDAVVDDIRGSVPGAEVLPVACDVGQESAATTIVSETLAKYGRIDVLVNNAGVRSYEPLDEAKAETWQKILSVNLLSYAYLSREAMPALRKSGKGAIVNISSTHAFNPRAGMGQYDVAKAGIISLTKTLAFEEVGNGVRVNAVCPGLTLTPFHVRRFAKEGRTEQDLREEKTNHNIQQRWADPSEVAYPILWLASDEASVVTAAVLMADGGTRV